MTWKGPRKYVNIKDFLKQIEILNFRTFNKHFC